MKKLPYYLLVVLIFGGIYLKTCRSDDMISASSNAILPLENWEEILVGKWHYEYERKSKATNFAWVEEAELQFYEDSTFVKRRVQLRYYSSYHKDKFFLSSSNNFLFLAGGTVRGYWNIGDNVIEETIDSCDVITSIAKHFPFENDYNPCNEYYPKKVIRKYGSFDTNTERYTIKLFSHNKILIEGEDISDEGEIEIKFTRMDN